MKNLIFSITVCMIATDSMAQSNMDNVLKYININNKAIHSNQKYWQSRQSGFKTGLTPYDPFVEYDYMLGSPAGAGNQRDFAVTQRMDFPTLYKRKKELSSSQIAQTEKQQQVFRQDILLEAKLLSLQIIYLNKKNSELNNRLRITQKLVQDYQKKLDNGDAIILDINKTKLQLLNIQQEVKLNENEKQVALTKINELNGGQPVVMNDTDYPILPAIPDFEILDSIIEANDPLLQVYEQEKGIMEREMLVQKAMNLPKLEAGYHSQGILGQSYKGFHAGITVPLWENKNKVNASLANIEYATSIAETHILEHRLENKQYYDLLDVRFTIIKDYKELLATLNNAELLNKALAAGQISVTQYFYDESFYFSAYDKYLQAEFEYHQAVAKLYKFQL